MEITSREIAELTDQEQRDMLRWIGEDSRLAELGRGTEAVARARAEAEHGSPDLQEFAEPEECPYDDDVAAEAA